MNIRQAWFTFGIPLAAFLCVLCAGKGLAQAEDQHQYQGATVSKENQNKPSSPYVPGGSANGANAGCDISGPVLATGNGRATTPSQLGPARMNLNKEEVNKMYVPGGSANGANAGCDVSGPVLATGNGRATTPSQLGPARMNLNKEQLNKTTQPGQ